MEKIFRIFSKEYVNINQAALLLGLFAFLSQILGLFRDRALAHFIGPGTILDSYYAAFRVPDFIFIAIASLASITVLIPFIVAKMKDGKVTPEASKFLNDIFTVFFWTMIGVAFFAFLIMSSLVDIVAPGFSEEIKTNVVILSRIMLLSPILMGLSNLFGTVTQLFRRFFIYSLSPILYNLGIIVGIVFLYPVFGIYGLAFGVVFGALLHFSIQFFASIRLGLVPRFSHKVNFKDIKKAVFTSFPRTLGLAFNSISLIAIVAIASFLESGSISIFNLSLNLQSVPLNIIGISFAVAVFPSLVKSFTNGDKGDFRNYLKSTARAIIFWSLPATFLFIVLRAQIVRVILGSGSFSWEHTRLVAASLALFAISILAQGMIALLSRAYYATGNTKRPLFVNLFSSILIVVLAYIFVYLFEVLPLFRHFMESLLKVGGIEGTKVLMLPLAYSVGTILNFILYWFFVKKELMNNEHFISKTFFQSLGASFFVGTVAYISLNIFSPIFGTNTFMGIFLQGLLSGLTGIFAGILVLYLLGSDELRQIAHTLKSKFSNSKVVAVPSE